MTNGENGDKPVRVSAQEVLPTTAYGLIAWAVNKVGPALVVAVLVLQFGGLPLLNEMIASNKEGRDNEAKQTQEMKEQSKILGELKTAAEATRQAIETSNDHKTNGIEQFLVEQRKTREAIDSATLETKAARETNMKILIEEIRRGKAPQ